MGRKRTICSLRSAASRLAGARCCFLRTRHPRARMPRRPCDPGAIAPATQALSRPRPGRCPPSPHPPPSPFPALHATQAASRPRAIRAAPPASCASCGSDRPPSPFPALRGVFASPSFPESRDVGKTGSRFRYLLDWYHVRRNEAISSKPLCRLPGVFAFNGEKMRSHRFSGRGFEGKQVTHRAFSGILVAEKEHDSSALRVKGPLAGSGTAHEPGLL